MPYLRAPEGGTCIICRTGYRRGEKVQSYGGWFRHLRCTPKQQ
jgi:hypothetical protein